MSDKRATTVIFYGKKSFVMARGRRDMYEYRKDRDWSLRSKNIGG